MVTKTSLFAALAATLLPATGNAYTISCAEPPGNPSPLADCNCAVNMIQNPGPDAVGVQAGSCYTVLCGQCYLSMSPYKGYESLATLGFLKSSAQAIISQCIAPNGIGTGLQRSDGEVPVVAVSPSQCPEVVNGLAPAPTIQPIGG